MTQHILNLPHIKTSGYTVDTIIALLCCATHIMCLLLEGRQQGSSLVYGQQGSTSDIRGHGIGGAARNGRDSCSKVRQGGLHSLKRCVAHVAVNEGGGGVVPELESTSGHNVSLTQSHILIVHVNSSGGGSAPGLDGSDRQLVLSSHRQLRFPMVVAVLVPLVPLLLLPALATAPSLPRLGACAAMITTTTMRGEFQWHHCSWQCSQYGLSQQVRTPAHTAPQLTHLALMRCEDSRDLHLLAGAHGPRPVAVGCLHAHPIVAHWQWRRCGTQARALVEGQVGTPSHRSVLQHKHGKVSK